LPILKVYLYFAGSVPSREEIERKIGLVVKKYFKDVVDIRAMLAHPYAEKEYSVFITYGYRMFPETKEEISKIERKIASAVGASEARIEQI